MPIDPDFPKNSQVIGKQFYHTSYSSAISVAEDSNLRRSISTITEKYGFTCNRGNETYRLL